MSSDVETNELMLKNFGLKTSYLRKVDEIYEFRNNLRLSNEEDILLNSLVKSIMSNRFCLSKIEKKKIDKIYAELRGS